MVDEILAGVNCALSKEEMEESGKSFRRQEIRCSKTRSGSCGICDYVAQNQETLGRIKKYLEELPVSEANPETKKWKAALDIVMKDPAQSEQLDACLDLGDLFIALESSGIGTMYTMNAKDSKLLAKPLGQNLLVRPNMPTNDERKYLASDERWSDEGLAKS